MKWTQAVVVALALGTGGPCLAAEIPADLDPVAVAGAGIRPGAAGLDRAELAERARADLGRSGGELTKDDRWAIAFWAAVAVVIYLF